MMRLPPGVSLGGIPAGGVVAASDWESGEDASETAPDTDASGRVVVSAADLASTESE
jgi:hypothetical protein